MGRAEPWLKPFALASKPSGQFYGAFLKIWNCLAEIQECIQFKHGPLSAFYRFISDVYLQDPLSSLRGMLEKSNEKCSLFMGTIAICYRTQSICGASGMRVFGKSAWSLGIRRRREMWLHFDQSYILVALITPVCCCNQQGQHHL